MGSEKICRLSVNINKIATLRNSRGGQVPNVLKTALVIESFGAEGITVHPRPDERHITQQDVLDLYPKLSTEFNIEGYPDDRYMALCKEARPAQATLVPDKPDQLTSNHGWNTRTERVFLKEVIEELKSYGCRVSLFIDPVPELIVAAKETGADRVELYTGPYAEMYEQNRDKAITPYVVAAKAAEQVGLGLNAGHDLNLHNLSFFAANIPNLLEVSIGHALISDALYYGLENVVRMYKDKLGVEGMN